MPVQNHNDSKTVAKRERSKGRQHEAANARKAPVDVDLIAQHGRVRIWWSARSSKPLRPSQDGW